MSQPALDREWLAASTTQDQPAISLEQRVDLALTFARVLHVNGQSTQETLAAAEQLGRKLGLRAIVYHPIANPHGLMAGITAMIAVSAMASQFALLRLAVPGVPSTAVMTGNLTHTVLSQLDTISGGQPLMEGAHERLKKTLKLVIGFFAGCVAGAAAAAWLGDWAWSFPVALAAVTVALNTRAFSSSGSR